VLNKDPVYCYYTTMLRTKHLLSHTIQLPEQPTITSNCNHGPFCYDCITRHLTKHANKKTGCPKCKKAVTLAQLTQLNGVKTSAAAASDSDNDSEYDSDTAAMDIDVDAAATSGTAKKGKKKSKKAKTDNNDDNGDGAVGDDKNDSECGVIMQSKVNALIEKLQAIRGNCNCNTLSL
jgi:Zinc finger, C3HC4 type (RING finger)